MFKVEAGSLRWKGPTGEEQMLDISWVGEIERRVDEIAFVNRYKAPELQAFLSRGYKELHDRYCETMVLLAQAKQFNKFTRGQCLLDRVPKVIEDRKLGGRSPIGSEDVRDAIMAQDAHVLTAQEYEDAMTALLEWFKGKLYRVTNAHVDARAIAKEFTPGAAAMDVNTHAATSVGRNGSQEIVSTSPTSTGPVDYWEGI